MASFGSAGALLSMGPSLFVLSHLGASFRIHVMIGKHYNSYVVRALQSGFSIFDYIFIPLDLVEKATLKIESLKPRNTTHF